jgi:hypothetical protein
MARTGLERYNDSMDYINEKISTALYIRLGGAANALDKSALGDAISLSGASYWRHGSKDQHRAVRALLLCQKVFLNPPYAKDQLGQPFTYYGDAGEVKTLYLKQTEAVVQNALKCYAPKATANRQDLIDAASDQRADNSNLDFMTLTREIDPFPRMQICFDAVRMWLFKSGFVSIAWLANRGTQMVAQTANDMLGNGVKVTLNDLATFPAGYMFNFHRKGDKAVCHWGISLGGGWGVAANTSSTAGSGTDRKDVNFQWGDGVYGKFRLIESYEVCARKYRLLGRETLADMVIRKIDPTAVTSYF